MTPWSTVEQGKQPSLWREYWPQTPSISHLETQHCSFLPHVLYLISSSNLQLPRPEHHCWQSLFHWDFSRWEPLETCFVTKRICSALVNEGSIVIKRGHLLKCQSRLDSRRNIIIGKIQKLMWDQPNHVTLRGCHQGARLTSEFSWHCSLALRLLFHCVSNCKGEWLPEGKLWDIASA